MNKITSKLTEMSAEHADYIQKEASMKATFKPLRRYVGNLTGKNVKTVTRRYDRLLGAAEKLNKATEDALNHAAAKLKRANHFRISSRHSSETVQGLSNAEKMLGNVPEGRRILIGASDARKARVRTLLLGRNKAYEDAYSRHGLVGSKKPLIASDRLNAIAKAENTRDNARAYTALGVLGVGGAGAIAIGASRQ